MKCPRCGTQSVIYRQVNGNGAKVVVERCPDCRYNPNAGKAFLPLKDYDWESLPLFEDYAAQAHPCEVRGCENVGSEYHHFAPKHLFDNYGDWHTGYLCREHHAEWHERTNTGSYITRIIKKVTG
jgi:ssDNA-binding Zn-finger/Zn-ribbon topoisomerase 1